MTIAETPTRRPTGRPRGSTSEAEFSFTGTPPGPWAVDAACRGRYPSFDADAPAVDRELAVTLCAACPVVVDCGAYADTHRLLGTWGGRLRTVSSLRRGAVTAA